MLGPQERWWRSIKIAILALAVAVVLTLINGTRHLAERAVHVNTRVVGGLGWLALLVLIMLVWRNIFSAAKNAARFIDDPRSEAAKGSMAQVKAQLGGLIDQGLRYSGRLVIFVDDLERCRAARAVEVFEVATQLLAHKGVVTVLLADMQAISTAAQAAYAGDTGGADSGLGRRYLEKLVQLELELPPPSDAAMNRLLRGTHLGLR